MNRYEIIANRSVEEDLLELLEEARPGISYSIVPGTFGRGRQGVRRGDPVWPEKNFIMILYAEDEEQDRAVLRAVRALKTHFPKEGVKLFGFSVEPISLDFEDESGQ